MRQQLITQKLPHYQHKDGTCYCGSCLCGQCKCQVPPEQVHYDSTMKSVYENDFKGYSIQKNYIKAPPQYSGKQKSMSLHSVYQEEYPVHDLTPVYRKQSITYERGIPFCSINKYRQDFGPQSYVPPEPIKPVNQIQLLPQTEKYKSSYSRAYKGVMPLREEFINLSKLMNKRLHVKNEKSIYLNSSYHETFKGVTAKREERLPVQPSLMPFGLLSHNVNSTTNSQSFTLQRRLKCPASEKLSSQ